jgi:hypothetical protein
MGLTDPDSGAGTNFGRGFCVWEVERLSDGVIQAPQRGVTLGGAGKLASGNEIVGIDHELSIPEADQSAVLDFANYFYSQPKIFSHFLVSIRVHSSPSLIEI